MLFQGKYLLLFKTNINYYTNIAQLKIVKLNHKSAHATRVIVIIGRYSFGKHQNVFIEVA